MLVCLLCTYGGSSHIGRTRNNNNCCSCNIVFLALLAEHHNDQRQNKMSPLMVAGALFSFVLVHRRSLLSHWKCCISTDKEGQQTLRMGRSAQMFGDCVELPMPGLKRPGHVTTTKPGFGNLWSGQVAYLLLRALQGTRIPGFYSPESFGLVITEWMLLIQLLQCITVTALSLVSHCLCVWLRLDSLN